MEQPKKRHDALIPMSRWHHELLVMAQVLRSDVSNYEGMPSDMASKTAYMKEQWEKLVAPLIQVEQNHIYPLLAHHHAGADSLLEGLKSLTQELIHAKKRSEGEKIEAAHLDLIAHQLIAWVRFKERQLFQWMQHEIDEKKLNELGKQISAIAS